MLETNKMLDEIVSEMNVKIANLKVAMSDIASQQSDLDIRRSRTEGRIYEIEWCIEKVMGKVEDENEVKPLIVQPDSSQYHGTRI